MKWMFGLGFLLMGCMTNDRSIRELKLAHGLDTKHPVHLGMEFFAQKVREKSNGKLEVKIYPNQQLGTERQNLELLQIGSLAMTKVSGAVMESFAPNFEVLSIPYLFKNRAHVYAMQDSEVGEELLIQGQLFRLRGLTYFDAGMRSFYAKSPIQRPEDIENKKIRVQESVTAMNLVKSYGGAPTPVSWGELYTALQQGVVDGAENNPPSFFISRHYEVCKYYTLNEHTAVPDLLVMSTLVWDRLLDDQKKWITDAAEEAKFFQRKLWQESELDALKAVKEAGVEIVIPEKKPFIEKTRHLIGGYRQQGEKYALIKKIQALSEYD